MDCQFFWLNISTIYYYIDLKLTDLLFRLERPSSVRETLPFYNQSRWELHWWVPQAVYVLWRHLAFVRIQVSNFMLSKQFFLL